MPFVFTRRRFLSGSAGALAGAMIGCGRRSSGSDFDLCIIGSGFAGLHLGLRTVQAGFTTVIVEAGSTPSSDPNRETLESSFGFTNSGSVRYALNSVRVIAVGGTSRHWGGVVTRLWPNDFRMRSEFGLLTDWPLGYDDLEPYYCRTEQLLSVQGYAPEAGAEPPRACPFPDELAGPYHPPDVEVEGQHLPFFGVAHSRRGGGPVRLLQREVPDFEASPLGTLLKDRQVTRIATAGGRVDHVETRGVDGSSLDVRARYYVVAAGAVESPRLLLLSTSPEFPQGIGNGHGLVGRYFNVHPSLQTKFEHRSAAELPDGSHRTCALNDVYRREGLNACHFQIDNPRRGTVRWRVQPEIEPRPENCITLNPAARDRFDNPLPDVRLDYSERDRRTFARAHEFLRQTKLELGADAPSIRDLQRWRAHPAGACRMGFDETTGVVDANLKVFGVDNLFVSGSCTFPTSGTANPTCTVVAMTLRLADHLTGVMATGA